jgi:hypothetical protein
VTLHPNVDPNQPYTLSNSELQVFKDCRRKWWLSYYRRLKPKQQKMTGPLALGTRIHAALDEYYTNGTPLLDIHSWLLETDILKAVSAGQDTTELEAEGELGRIMLEGFLQWIDEEGIDSEYEIISNEEVLSMPLLDGEVILQGKLDQRVRRKSDGVRMVRDFKTVGQSFPEYAKTAQMNEQFLTYLTLEAYNNPEETRATGALITMMKKVKRTASAKPPFYDQMTVNHNIFTLRAFWQRLQGTVRDLMGVKKALDAGESHLSVAYPTATRDCSWKCPFYQICPMFDDGSAVESAISDLYEEEDPYAYYGAGKKLDADGVE